MASEQEASATETSRGSEPTLREAALGLHRRGRIAEAIELYRRLLGARSRDAQLWNNLGVALRQQGQQIAAVAAYRRALEIAPQDARANSNLGNALKDLDRLEEALEAHRHALQFAPEDAGAWHNLAVALREAARHEEALAACNEALRLDPGRGVVKWDRALALLHLGRYAEGFQDYSARRLLGELPARRESPPEWCGEDLAGKRLLVYPEQGFGDFILASRFLAALRENAARLVVEIKPELQRLYEGLTSIDEITAAGSQSLDADFQVSVMDLPGLLGCSLETLPPPPDLSVPEAARKKLRGALAPFSDRFKVGIVWSGSTTFKGNAKRAVGPERFLPLAEISGVQLVSLQKGPPAKLLRSCGGEALVFDLAPHLDDFADTAAAIEALDLVIMTDSSVAHLAGTLGRPVWNLLGFSPYWVYGTQGESTPWYPAMRLFRQRRPADWDGVFAAASAALVEEVSERQPS